MNLSISWKNLVLKPKVDNLLKIEGNPKTIALGYSLGIYIGMMPLVGVKAFIAMAVAATLKWNKLAAGIGVFNINPLTAPFFFWLNYQVGKQVTGCTQSFEFSFENLSSLFSNGSDVLVTLAIGGALAGIPVALMAYGISYFLISKYNKKYSS